MLIVNMVKKFTCSGPNILYYSCSATEEEMGVFKTG